VNADNREIEVFLSAPPGRRLRTIASRCRQWGVAVTDLGLRRVRDVYVDTPDCRLLLAGMACRIRRYADRSELTLKGIISERSDVAARREITSNLPAAGLPLSELAARLPARLRRRVGREPLHVLFRVNQARHVHRLALSQGTSLVLSIDSVVIVSGCRRRRVSGVEIELHRGRIEDLVAFAARLRRNFGLRRSRTSKFEKGLRLAGLSWRLRAAEEERRAG